MAGKNAKRPATAIEYGIALVAARSRTEKGLRERLEARYPESEVVAAMDRLRELRMVDDAVWAVRFVQDRSGRVGHGRHRIGREMVRRGIDAATVEKALAEALPEEGERVRALAVLATLRSRLGVEDEPSPTTAGHAVVDRMAARRDAERIKARLFRRMLARGYSASLVRDLLAVS